MNLHHFTPSIGARFFDACFVGLVVMVVVVSIVTLAGPFALVGG